MQKAETSWHDQMVRKLQINGKSERTQEAYTRAVRQLMEHYKKDPELINEEELEEYFLYRRNESQWAVPCQSSFPLAATANFHLSPAGSATG